jgi:catechol 2,3-dioxygenase-like lactoylglutathione lyase family enzyme
MALHRLLSMRVGVPDPHGLGAFYDEMGLSGDDAGRYRGTDGGATVQVEHHAFRRLLEVVVGAADDADLDRAAERSAARGVPVTRSSDAVTIVDPHSLVTFRVQVAEPFTQAPIPAHVDNAPGTTVRRNARAGGVFAGPRPPRRLGHLVLGTPDLAATRDLLVDGIGFRVSDDMAPIISFLRCSTDHHNVGIVESPVPLLQHYSWECDDVDHVGHSATNLLRADQGRQVWGFGRHYVGSNYYWYLRDPAGSFVELYSDMDVIDDDEVWEREGRTPVGFEHVANSWGPDIPMEFIAPDDIEELKAAWASKEPA